MCNVRKEKDDVQVWKGDQNLKYTRRSTYERVRNELRGEKMTVYDKFWRIKALPTTQVRTWRVLNNKVATFDNLYKKEIQVRDRKCILCK